MPVRTTIGPLAVAVAVRRLFRAVAGLALPRVPLLTAIAVAEALVARRPLRTLPFGLARAIGTAGEAFFRPGLAIRRTLVPPGPAGAAVSGAGAIVFATRRAVAAPRAALAEGAARLVVGSVGRAAHGQALRHGE